MNSCFKSIKDECNQVFAESGKHYDHSRWSNRVMMLGQSHYCEDPTDHKALNVNATKTRMWQDNRLSSFY